MFSAAGQMPRPNILAIMAFTRRRSLKPKDNDNNHASIDDSKYSPPCPLGPVGNPISSMDVCHVHAADSPCGHLSRWVERWIRGTLAISFPSDCLERVEANPLDIRNYGGDQRGHGNTDRLC